MAVIMLAWIGLVLMWANTWAYPEGASESACDSMTPFHRFQAQEGPPPFAINVSADTYGPNESINVTLYAPCGKSQFKGFLLQARSLDVETIRRVGRFDEPPGSHHLQRCGKKGQAVTHDINSFKTSMQFEWTAPQQASGHVVMTVTFVQRIDLFWVKILSPVVRDRSLPPHPIPVEETYPTAVQDCSVTPKPSVRGDPCDAERNCFARCDGSTCDMAVTWSKVTDSEEVLFNMAAVVGRGSNHWMSLAFSDDQLEGNDSVVECLTFEGNTSIHLCYSGEPLHHNHSRGMVFFAQYYMSADQSDWLRETHLQNMDFVILTQKPNFNLDVRNVARTKQHTDEEAVTKVSGTLHDGVFGCSFRRQVKVENNSWVADLNMDWYLIFSWGHTANDSDVKDPDHDEPVISQRKFHFYGEPATTTTAVKLTTDATTPKSSGNVKVTVFPLMMAVTLLAAIVSAMTFTIDI